MIGALILGVVAGGSGRLQRGWPFAGRGHNGTSVPGPTAQYDRDPSQVVPVHGRPERWTDVRR